MGSIGDVYQLVDQQAQAGQQVLNVYFYRLDTPVVGNAAQFLAESWVDNVLPDITAWQCVDVVHTAVIVTNLFNESEQHTELISEAGSGASTVMPTFVAVGFQLIGDNAAVRDGQKRYAGIDEGVVTDGVITDATLIGQLVALGVTLATGLPIGLDADALIPVIVGRILTGGSYRLPTNSGEAVLSEIIDALFNVDVTSQTSRKPGRGA